MRRTYPHFLSLFFSKNKKLLSMANIGKQSANPKGFLHGNKIIVSKGCKEQILLAQHVSHAKQHYIGDKFKQCNYARIMMLALCHNIISSYWRSPNTVLSHLGHFLFQFFRRRKIISFRKITQFSPNYMQLSLLTFSISQASPEFLLLCNYRELRNHSHKKRTPEVHHNRRMM